MSARTYVERFDRGTGGWAGWGCPVLGPGRSSSGERHGIPLELDGGTAISRSPWWIDANHAPPGGGYLHLLFVHWTTRDFPADYTQVAGVSRFVEDGFPTDFTNARMTLRIRGELDAKGTDLVLLIQAKVGDIQVNYLLTGQPFKVSPDWSEQTVTLVDDPKQWRCIGSRHDLTHQYGYSEISTVLQQVNHDIILVLHPLDIVPMEPVKGDPHMLYAGRDYPVDESRLPAGYVMLDEVRIEFPEARQEG